MGTANKFLFEKRSQMKMYTLQIDILVLRTINRNINTQFVTYNLEQLKKWGSCSDLQESFNNNDSDD